MSRHDSAEVGLELSTIPRIVLTQEKKQRAKEIFEDALATFSSSLERILKSHEDIIEQSKVLTCIINSFKSFSPTKKHLIFTYRRSSSFNYPIFTVIESSLIDSNDVSDMAQKIYDLMRQIASNLHHLLGDTVYTYIKSEECTHIKARLVNAGIFERVLQERKTRRSSSNHSLPNGNAPDTTETETEEKADRPNNSTFVPLNTALSPDFPQLFRPMPLFGNTVSLWFSLGLFELFTHPNEGEPDTLRTSKFNRVKYGLMQIKGLLLLQRLDKQTTSNISLVQLICNISNLINTHRKRTYNDPSRPISTLSGKRLATLLLKRDNAYFRRIILEDAYAISHHSDTQTHPLSQQAQTLLVGFFELQALKMQSEFLLKAHRNGTATPSSDHISRLGTLLRAWGKCRYVLKCHHKKSRKQIQSIMNELFDPGSSNTHSPLTSSIPGDALEKYAHDNATRYKAEMKLSRLRGEML